MLLPTYTEEEGVFNMLTECSFLDIASFSTKSTAAPDFLIQQMYTAYQDHCKEKNISPFEFDRLPSNIQDKRCSLLLDLN